MSLRAPKSIPSISPRALCRRSQKLVARSEFGAAMRATMAARAQQRWRRLKPRPSNNAGRPRPDSASSPACSTPTERPSLSLAELTSTLCQSRFAPFPAAVFPAANQQGGDSAGLGLDPRIGIGEAEGGLSGEMIRDASAQVRPVPAPDCKMAPEIENGALTDPVPLAAVLDQAEGDLVAAVAGGAGLGLSNEHAAAIAKGIPRRKALLKKHGTTNDSETSNHNKSMSCESNTVKSTSNPTQKC